MNMTEVQVESVFFAALERGSPTERAAWLDEACAGDEELRRRVEQLLAAHPRLGGFLEPQGLALESTAAMPPIAEGPGTQIGPYKLLEHIGEGGQQHGGYGRAEGDPGRPGPGEGCE